MLFFSNPVRDPRLAFTLTEVMVAVGVVGILFVSLYLAFSAGFSMIQSTRENLGATEVLVQHTETLRLYTWSQLTGPTYKTNFTVDATNTSGITYFGDIALSTPTAASYGTYANDIRIITIGVRWTNAFGKPLPHYRSMQTQVARNGLLINN